jgi:hypothetical protein
MSQRDSGFERKERDLYETPEWVTMALLDAGMRPPSVVWEPASGSGKMVRALGILDAEIVGSDIHEGQDFFSTEPPCGCDAIITNPPYGQAADFIQRSIALMQPSFGQVAMLLRTDFDHARTRGNLFAGHTAFSRKLVLTKRIRWFEDSTGSPSFNHAWFIWDWKHQGAPTLAYGPQ